VRLANGETMKIRTWWLLLAIALVASSCSDGRSVEALCTTFEEETDRLNEKYNERAALVDSQEGLLGLGLALGSLLEAQGDLVVFLDRLERAAPEEIAPDVAAVRDAVRKQADATTNGDPLQMLLEGAVTAFQISGPAGRVDTYLRENCVVGQLVRDQALRRV